ncbi:unnamed protein product, partial [Hapterophycus canaliculatus]
MAVASAQYFGIVGNGRLHVVDGCSGRDSGETPHRSPI